jgi:hypothetical protein
MRWSEERGVRTRDVGGREKQQRQGEEGECEGEGESERAREGQDEQKRWSGGRDRVVCGRNWGSRQRESGIEGLGISAQALLIK